MSKTEEIKPAAFTSFSGKTRIQTTDTARPASFSEIPIISLATPLPQLVDEIRDACTRVGFFYIKDHNVPQEVIDGIFQTANDFFALTREKKDEINYKKSRILRGYEPPAEVRTDETKKADMNEAFNWGYSLELDPLVDDAAASSEDSEIEKSTNPMIGPNVWPDVPQIPKFKSSIKAYYGNILTLGRRLVSLFALVLDLPESYFDAMFARPGAMGRLLHYPPQDPTSTSNFGIGAHTDIECFTILCQDTHPALQILNTEGEWLSAPPIPGTFVVNIGDMLSYWSNDTFVSTVHRVLNITGEERYSIPFFMGPNYETVLEPLESCVMKNGGEKQYQTIIAGDYVWRRLARSRLSEEEYKLEIFKKDSVTVM